MGPWGEGEAEKFRDVGTVYLDRTVDTGSPRGWDVFNHTSLSGNTQEFFRYATSSLWVELSFCWPRNVR